MALFKATKVVAALPGVLAADTLYAVRTGAGFDLYISDSTGGIAHALNPPAGFFPVGTVFYVGMNTPPAGSIKANGALLSRTTYAALFAYLVKTAVAAMTIATPGVVTWTAHGRSANDTVKFTTTGALPTGFVAGTTYYVVGASITADTFTLSATPGGAAIATSGSQSGVHTAIHAPHGDGDGSTTFAAPDGRTFPRGWDDGRGLDPNRVFGSTQTDELRSHTHTQHYLPGGSAAYLASNLDYYFDGASGVTGATGGADTHPHNIALLACIKY
ncbi:MAG: phage tail protein [Burkholderiaceae bacterium]|nr:phage tail protein [Burkholderiaceae bacterium]